MLNLPDPDLAQASVIGLAYEYPAGSVPAHSHALCAQVMYSVHGAMTVLTDEGQWVLPPQRALWIPAGMVHTTFHARPISLRTVYVRQSAEGVPPWRHCSVMQVTPLVRELILACVALPWAYPENGVEARLARVLLDHLALLPQESFYLPEPSDPRALKAANILKRDVSDTRPLTFIAQEAGASDRTLERLFANETGMSFGAWRQRLRLMVALEHLAAGDGVNATAAAVGYENPSSFIAVFRSVFGCTPARYFSSKHEDES